MHCSMQVDKAKEEEEEMFYSQTFLGKKSPLGTVWIAAHIQRRIKRPQIGIISIPRYADYIFNEVPLALRLSGHLLLGLTRIYSWKVNYLLQDCDKMMANIKMMFPAAQVDLPEDADRAPFETVTRPATFSLDAMELEYTGSEDGRDNHMRSYEQITMIDQSMVGEDPYIAIMLDEDSRVNSTPQSRPTIEPMEIDVLPPIDVDMEVLNAPIYRDISSGDTGSTREVGISFQTSSESRLLQEDLQFEVPRDPVHDYDQGSAPGFDNTDSVLGKIHAHSGPAMNQEHSPSPSMTHSLVSGNESLLTYRLVSGNESLSSPKHANETTIAPMDDLDILNTGISMGQSLHLNMQPTPPVERQRQNTRKRKQFFDEALVISNVEMKKQLDNATKLVCKRRKLPCSLLDVWRFQSIHKNKGILHAPLLSGMCSTLKEVLDRKYTLSRVDSAPSEHYMGNTCVQTDPEMPARNLEVEQPDRDMGSDQLNKDLESELPTRDMEPTQPTREMEPEQPYRDMEHEQPRIDTNTDANTHGKDAFPSDREEGPPSHFPNLGSSPDKENTFGVVEPTIEPLSSKLDGIEAETPIHLEVQQYTDTMDLESTGFPSLLNLADAEDLNFLEASNTSSSSEISEHYNMSERTRAVAQYFKEHSPGTGTLANRWGSLSLIVILEGKTRKQCARMFFETLVLKSNDFIDVRQEEPYGDINIYPTSKLGKFT